MIKITGTCRQVYSWSVEKARNFFSPGCFYIFHQINGPDCSLAMLTPNSSAHQQRRFRRIQQGLLDYQEFLAQKISADGAFKASVLDRAITDQEFIKKHKTETPRESCTNLAWFELSRTIKEHFDANRSKLKSKLVNAFGVGSIGQLGGNQDTKFAPTIQANYEVFLELITNLSDTQRGFTPYITTFALPYDQEADLCGLRQGSYRLLKASTTENNTRSISISRFEIFRNPADTESHHWNFEYCKQRKNDDQNLVSELRGSGVILVNFNLYTFMSRTRYIHHERDFPEYGFETYSFSPRPDNLGRYFGVVTGCLGYEKHQRRPFATKVVLIPDLTITDDQTGVFDFDSDNKEHQLVTNYIDDDWNLLLAD